MKINKNALILAIIYAATAYLLTSQIIYFMFCLIIAIFDYILFIRKEGINKLKKSKEEAFKNEFLYYYLLNYRNNGEKNFEETLAIFDNEYKFLDKEELASLAIKEIEPQLKMKINEYKRTTNLKKFYGSLHIQAINKYFENREKKIIENKNNNNLISILLFSFVNLIVCRILINNYYSVLLSHKIFYISILILLAIWWLVCRKILLKIGEDDYYAKEN